jgi:peptidoglycan/LPS O-acetylase OafA/YrhL
MKNSQIPVLNFLRAFAALSVCLYHFVCTTTGYITTDWILNFFSQGKYGVQLFFVISGFIIPWSMWKSDYSLKNFFVFLLKRLARLEPPYLMSLILAITILMMR